MEELTLALMSCGGFCWLCLCWWVFSILTLATQNPHHFHWLLSSHPLPTGGQGRGLPDRSLCSEGL